MPAYKLINPEPSEGIPLVVVAFPVMSGKLVPSIYVFLSCILASIDSIWPRYDLLIVASLNFFHLDGECECYETNPDDSSEDTIRNASAWKNMHVVLKPQPAVDHSQCDDENATARMDYTKNCWTPALLIHQVREKPSKELERGKNKHYGAE